VVGVVGWPVTVGVVSQPGAVQVRMCKLHTRAGWAW